MDFRLRSSDSLTCLLVGTARCAVRAAFSGATGGVIRASGVVRSARFAGGDIAARCRYHSCYPPTLPPILPPWKSRDAKRCRAKFRRGSIRKKEIYFVTINCEERFRNQLALPDASARLFETVRHRQEKFLWWPYLFLLMPDHLHALLSFPPSGKPLKLVVSKWKEWTAKELGIVRIGLKMTLHP